MPEADGNFVLGLPIEEFRLYLYFFAVLLTNCITVWIFKRNSKDGDKNRSNERLFKLQELSLSHPFLENQHFISGWNEFKEKYTSNRSSIDFSCESNQRYFQYEQYCEMIFNLASSSFDAAGNEKKLLQNIDFKSWCRSHKCWWENPLDSHSNRDTYDGKFCDMVDGWMK
ncbi:hypothetical protein FCL40_16940 [Ferrimonas sediminicola]|uniref:Uncharacterized protein n=1 Tax=Ferrimonas sediminicola TaxID=2569538 RepID=A0A4U1B872_9GAMM|nr:hypothetical protein [Ferrimonas sediminicola]TKB46861.1 hypothetical protein FCL40_16940 [Ferrimonas sediminicola]